MSEMKRKELEQNSLYHRSLFSHIKKKLIKHGKTFKDVASPNPLVQWLSQLPI